VPNGHDKNWVRLCGAIDGFRVRYGRWPTRVRAYPMSLRDFDFLFTPEDLARIRAKIALVGDDLPMIVEDDSGAQYDYGREGFPVQAPDVRAADWLEVSPIESHSTDDGPEETLGVRNGVFKGWEESGSGVITPDDGSADLPVHESAVSDAADFETGQRVSFEVEMNLATHQQMAVRIAIT
jgi:cold shock CspA family protein